MQFFLAAAESPSENSREDDPQKLYQYRLFSAPDLLRVGRFLLGSLSDCVAARKGLADRCGQLPARSPFHCS